LSRIVYKILGAFAKGKSGYGIPRLASEASRQENKQKNNFLFSVWIPSAGWRIQGNDSNNQLTNI